MTVVGGRTSLVDLALSSVTNTAGDFLTLSGGVVHKRTAAQTLTDIGGQAALTNPVTGTGNTNYLSKFTSNGSTTIGNTNIINDSNGTLILGGTSSSGTAGTGSGRGNLILAGSISNKLTFNNDSTTVNGYVYSDGSELQISSGAGFMNFYTGNGERLRIFTDGNVSISNSPSNAGFKLDVNGTGRFSAASTDYALTLQNIQDDSQGLLVRATDNDGLLYLIRAQSSNSSISQTWVDRFTLAKNGEATFSSSVTANAASQINGTAALSTQQVSTILTLQRPFNSGVSFENTATFNVGQGSTYRDGRLDITLSNTDRVQATIMTLLSSGNVGIGTASPGVKLDILGTAGNILSDMANGNLINLDGGSISSTDFGIGIAFVRTGSQMAYIKAARENSSNEAGYLAFATQTSGGFHPERMRISSGGNILIGTQTSGASKLRIVGLPTSAAGLSSGDVYSDSGTLKIA
jgi:hypothetical protein